MIKKALLSTLFLPMFAMLGCPGQNVGACRAGLDSPQRRAMLKWEHKQDVKWNRFVRDVNRKFND